MPPRTLTMTLADETPAPTPLPHADPNQLARRLGYAGLIPFVGGTLFIWLLLGRIDEEPFAFVVRALTGYAALILSFLGGMRWGLVMPSSQWHGPVPGYQRRALWTGIAFSLMAWVGLLMPPHAGLAWLGAWLIACYLADRKHYLELGAAGWLTLRFRLSTVASLCCFTAAAQI